MAFQPARFTRNPFTRSRRALLPPIFTLTFLRKAVFFCDPLCYRALWRRNTHPLGGAAALRCPDFPHFWHAPKPRWSGLRFYGCKSTFFSEQNLPKLQKQQNTFIIFVSFVQKNQLKPAYFIF
jgi:hypothetical protein